MQTIGERLEEARKRKGISVREAAEATKIRSDYLQKFEANSFDLDLPPLYIRGFVRNYARFLELDQERFIAEYDSVVTTEGRAPRRTETRENLGRVEFAEGGDNGKRSGGDQALILKYSLLGGGALAVIALILLLINWAGSSSSSSEPKPKASTTTTSVQPTPPPPVETVQTLALTAMESTRVKIAQDSDKAVLFEGSIARGETRNFRKNGKLLITVEKGSNLRMEVNGRNYPMPIDGYGRFALD